MYRKSAAPEDAVASPPAELVYAAVDRARRGGSGFAALQFFSMPMVVGIAGSMLIGPTAGLVGLVGSAVFAIWWWRRAPHAGGLILRVEDGELLILSKSRKEKARFPLADVDVEMDTKTIQRVQEGGDAIPAMRFINSTVGPELDTKRIVVVAKSKRLPLTDDFLGHTETSEWFGKIRVFLRKSGWIPRDEQPESAAPSSDAPDSTSDVASDSER